MALARHSAHLPARADRGLSTFAYAVLPATIQTDELSSDVMMAIERELAHSDGVRAGGDAIIGTALLRSIPTCQQPSTAMHGWRSTS
jgi:hypothetical protein